MERKDQGIPLPFPFERLKQIGGSLVSFVAPGPEFGEKLHREVLEQRGYEDGIIIDLRGKVQLIDEIDDAKSRHPSSKNLH